MTAADPRARVTPYDLSVHPDLSDWRLIAGVLATRWETRDFRTGAALVAQIAEVADSLDHHPDLDLRYSTLDVRTWSHDVHHVTSRDVELARRISALARAAGVIANPRTVSALELGIDVLHEEPVRRFWAAVLGYRDLTHLVADPAGRHPDVWFQQMDEPRTERNRIHVDLDVPHDVAEERIAAALEAGGRLVTAEHAPKWWVLADPEGNEVCVCTWQGRAGSGEP